MSDGDWSGCYVTFTEQEEKRKLLYDTSNVPEATDVKDVNANEVVIPSHSVKTETHCNGFAQTHWHAYAQTPRQFPCLFSNQMRLTPCMHDTVVAKLEDPDRRSSPRMSWFWNGTNVISNEVLIVGDTIKMVDDFGTKLEWEGGNHRIRIGKFYLRTRKCIEAGKILYGVGVETQHLDQNLCDIFHEDKATVIVRACKNSLSMQLRLLLRGESIEADIEPVPTGPDFVAWINILRSL